MTTHKKDFGEQIDLIMCWKVDDNRTISISVESYFKQFIKHKQIAIEYKTKGTTQSEIFDLNLLD